MTAPLVRIAPIGLAGWGGADLPDSRWAIVAVAPADAILEALLGPRLKGADPEAIRAEALAALLLPDRAAICAHCARPYLPGSGAGGTWCPLPGCQRARERAFNRAAYRRKRERAAASPPPG